MVSPLSGFSHPQSYEMLPFTVMFWLMFFT